ncbi:MAG: Rrf2 family transcriptional regulator [Phycisphaeraceae bacterium]
MQLTLFSDYALRILLYLAVHEDQTVSVSQIARAYRTSRHHMVKVAHLLVKLKLVRSVRGRNGGLQLAVPKNQINLGQVVRQTEPHFELVECFNDATNTCPISPACNLKGVLQHAQSRFLAVLDDLTVEDLMGKGPQLQALWAEAAATEDDPPPTPPPAASAG